MGFDLRAVAPGTGYPVFGDTTASVTHWLVVAAIWKRST